MATPALTELIGLLGDKEADRLYNLVIAEYTAHIAKHVAAAKLANPTKVGEAQFVEDVLSRVTNETKLHTLLGEELRRIG